MITKTFDGKEYRYHSAYRLKTQARMKADLLRRSGYNVRIYTILAPRGTNRHELYIRRS